MPPSPLPQDGQVEHVGAQAVGLVEVAEGACGGQLVGAEERGVGQAGGCEHALAHEVVERRAAGPLGEQRQHHEAAVAVREPLARRELRAGTRRARRGTPRRRSNSCTGTRHHVVGDLAVVVVLVEVVADARRWPSRCSTVTSSSTSGRSSPRSDRAVVSSASTPSSTRRITARAVKPLPPLATANRVSTVFGDAVGPVGQPVGALPAPARPARSTRTTPEKPRSSAAASAGAPARPRR